MAERHSDVAATFRTSRADAVLDGNGHLAWRAPRNGLPAPDPGWRPGAAQRADAARDRQARAQVAAVQRQAKGDPAGARQFNTPGSLLAEPEPLTPFDLADIAEAEEFADGHYPRPSATRCDHCGYKTDAPGHRIRCETP